MKAAAFVIALCVFAADVAVAQYPVYESPLVDDSTLVGPAYSLPVAQPYVVPAPASYVVPVPAYFTPVYSVYSLPSGAEMTYAPARIGIFGRLIELERRKNAWLRQSFRGGSNGF